MANKDTSDSKPHFNSWDLPEIRVRGVAESMPKQLENIAKNSGYDTRNDFLKVKLREIVDQAPEHLKREPT